MILTEQEIKRIGEGNTGSWQDDLQFARAIESAVLEKLKAQEPVAWAVYDIKYGGSQSIHWNHEHDPNGDHSQYKAVPLYLHPLPPDDVVQKYEELLYAVQRKFPDETRHQTALRYIKTAESPSYTNAAMKEMK